MLKPMALLLTFSWLLGGNIFETTSFSFVKSGRDCKDTQTEDG